MSCFLRGGTGKPEKEYITVHFRRVAFNFLYVPGKNIFARHVLHVKYVNGGSAALSFS